MILLLAIGMMATASAQKDSSKANVKLSGDLVFSNGSKEMIAKWSPKDSVLVIQDIKSLKGIKVLDNEYSPLQLASKEVINLPVNIQWIAVLYELMETAQTGKSKAEITTLQNPLAPYYRAYVDYVRKQQTAAPPKN